MAQALSQRLTEMVRTINGVDCVFAAEPVIIQAVNHVINLVNPVHDAGDLVSVRETDTGMTVRASIGVTELEPAPDVCRRVHDEIAHYLATENASRTATIVVKVSRIR